jgi:hypothetical protein
MNNTIFGSTGKRLAIENLRVAFTWQSQLISQKMLKMALLFLRESFPLILIFKKIADTFPELTLKLCWYSRQHLH